MQIGLQAEQGEALASAMHRSASRLQHTLWQIQAQGSPMQA